MSAPREVRRTSQARTIGASREACRACDGHGRVTKRTRLGIEESTKRCSACDGSGEVKPPSKGKRRFFSQMMDDDELSLEEQTKAFLRKHGH